ncbi:Kinesin-like protein KIF21A [Lamellibrachia satsuma]|nr:Kinesin-like protein KIF21A [Lamellibrachia satsuma]
MALELPFGREEYVDGVSTNSTEMRRYKVFPHTSQQHETEGRMGLSQTTANVNMNAQSHRSHTQSLRYISSNRELFWMEYKHMPDDGKEWDTIEIFTDFETLAAKFYFINLAGSERLKCSGATGNHAKQGISINCGLLAMGNVISALGTRPRRDATFLTETPSSPVSYRTRSEETAGV